MRKVEFCSFLATHTIVQNSIIRCAVQIPVHKPTPVTDFRINLRPVCFYLGLTKCWSLGKLVRILSSWKIPVAFVALNIHSN